MKTMKKIISLTMAAIMLFTGTSALQASELALDRTQMAEFQKEILQNVKLDLNKAKDPVKELIALHTELHAESQKDPKEIAQILIQKIKDIDPKILKEVAIQLLKLKAEAIKVAATDKRYSKISNKKEREQVALFTILRDVFEDEDKLGYIPITVGLIIMAVAVVIFFVYSTASILFDMFGKGAMALEIRSGGSLVAEIALGAGTAITFIGLLILTLDYLTEAYTPTLSPSLSEEETFEIFSKKPFDIIAEFDEPDFYLMYGKGPKCAQILSDVVYIESRIAKKGFENIDLNTGKEIMYLKTIDWYEMTPEERAAYLHQFAERLRAEAKQGLKEQFRNLKVGLEEA